MIGDDADVMGGHRRSGRHHHCQRCRRRRCLSSVVVVVVDGRQDVRVLADAGLTRGHVRLLCLSRARERRLEDSGALCVDVVVVADALRCRLRRRCRPIGVGFLVFAVFHFVEVVDGARVAAAGHSVLSDGGQHHSLAQTLLEAAVLTPVSLLLRDHALAVGDARVHALVLDRALEEALAALARDDAVVESRRAVFTYHAKSSVGSGLRPKTPSAAARAHVSTDWSCGRRVSSRRTSGV